MITFKRHSPNTFVLLSSSRSIAISLIVAALATPVLADESADVNKLLQAGQYVEALTKIDAALAKNPRDVQMRFLKGVILTEQNKSVDAIRVFTKLTEDFPSLPEPYNNLAVLYARNGQYDQARSALNAAIRTNPTYATAYENLGDVHAKLASQAYDRALQIDSANSAAKSKLTLVHTLVGNVGVAAKPATPIATAPAARVAQKPAAGPTPKVVAVASEPNQEVSKRETFKQDATEQDDVKQDALKQEAKLATSASAEQSHILTMVNSWARAWSSRDVKTYLDFYSKDFQTPKGQSRKKWENERHSRIVDKGRINVRVDEPQVSVNGNIATVKFRQLYVSDRLTSENRKTLVLAKRDGKWQIKQEQANN